MNKTETSTNNSITLKVMTVFPRAINKIGNALTTLTKKKRREDSQTKMRNGKENNTTDNHRNSVMTDYYKQLYTIKFDNLGKKDN